MTPQPLRVICGWCPNPRERTATAVAAGYTVSHGMCPACKAKQDAELDALEHKSPRQKDAA
jgi:hypothetical protein